MLKLVGSAGMRKRRFLYAHERLTNKHYKTPDTSLATTCAHRVCVLNSIEQQAQIMIQEIRVLQTTSTNKRIKPKIVIFVANSKENSK